MTASLLQAILDPSTRTPNYFNGRLLTATDLEQEHAAGAYLRNLLGQAHGDGVAFGFGVHVAEHGGGGRTPVFTVGSGVAINRQGQVLSLATDIDVGLMDGPPNRTTPVERDPGFATCDPFQPGVYVAGTGVYVLLVAPAGGTDGLAVVSGLGNEAAGCNVQANLGGVLFKALKLPLSATDLTDVAHLRNRVAHACFGTGSAAITGLHSDPFGARSNTYGLLEAARIDGQLTDCDVLLAAFHWTATGGVQFLDMWAVRRRIARRPLADPFGVLLDDRRLAEAEAVLLQFQDHLETIRENETNLASITAASRFQYLPPVGLLPVIGGNSVTGFTSGTFFPGAATRIDLLDGNALRSVVNEGLHHEPFAVNAPDGPRLYYVWQNLQAVAGGQSRQLALVFTSTALSPRGIARYDFSMYGGSRYASDLRL